MSAIAAAVAREMAWTGENGRLRCHWARVPSGPDGGEELVFVPGCYGMMFDGPPGVCDCDILTRRLELHIAQWRDLQAHLGEDHRQLRAWRRAGDAAWSLLTGKPGGGGHIRAQDLAAAVRRAAAKGGPR